MNQRSDRMERRNENGKETVSSRIKKAIRHDD